MERAGRIVVGWTAAAVALAAAAPRAQERQAAAGTDATTWTEVGRTNAVGGSCELLRFGGGGAWLLSAGSLGDLVAWDARTRTPVAHAAARGRHVDALAIHPSEPWALVVWSSPERPAAVWYVDLRDGACRLLACPNPDRVGFARDGSHFTVHHPAPAAQGVRATTFACDELRERLAATPGGGDRDGLALTPLPAAPPAPASTFAGDVRESPSGEHPTLWLEKRRAFERVDSRREQSPPLSFPDGVEEFAVADDGTIVAADGHGGVHWLGLDDRDRTFAAPNRGPARALVFTRDGRFLAVVGPAAVRVVDLAGREVHTFAGVHVVAAGTNGADLWLLGPRSLRCWNASTQRDIADERRWAEPAVALRHGNVRESALADMVANGLDAGHEAMPVMAVGARVLLPSGEEFFSEPMWIDAAPTKIAPERLGDGTAQTPIACASAGATDLPVALYRPFVGGCGLFAGDLVSALRAFPPEGGVVEWRSRADAQWLVVPAGADHAWVGIGAERRHVLRIDLATMTETGAVDLDRAVRAIAPCGPHLLALVGATWRVLHRDTLATLRSGPLPPGLEEAGLLAATADGRHVAVAHREDVRILRVE